jgi:hypothetical protein
LLLLLRLLSGAQYSHSVILGVRVYGVTPSNRIGCAAIVPMYAAGCLLGRVCKVPLARLNVDLGLRVVAQDLRVGAWNHSGTVGD